MPKCVSSGGGGVGGWIDLAEVNKQHLTEDCQDGIQLLPLAKIWLHCWGDCGYEFFFFF